MIGQRVYLFRHGEPAERYRHTYNGHTNIPLSQLGEKQAERIRDFISSLPFPKVVTSDLKRAFFSLPNSAEKVQGLREICFGAWEGLSWGEIEKQFPNESRSFLGDPVSFTFPGGESASQFSTRVMEHIDRIVGGGHELIVFVVHAGVIRVVLSKMLRIPLSESFNIPCDYGAYSMIERTQGVFVPILLNKAVS